MALTSERYRYVIRSPGLHYEDHRGEIDVLVARQMAQAGE
jgi:hypothetical protein